MKRKVAIMVVAALAVVVMAVSFTACDGGSGDVKSLYDAIFGLSNQYATTTTMSAVELDDLDGADVSVSGKALIAQRTDPDTNDVNYELWVGGTSQVYSGPIRPGKVSGADWCWYVNDVEMGTITAFTVDETVSPYIYEYEGSSVVAPYVVSGVLYLDGEPVYQYDSETDTVTEIGETEVGDEEPTLEPEGVMIELEDVDIELVDDTVARVYDKDGKALRLVNMENLVPGRRAEVVAATKKAVLLQELKELPADASDYDFYEGADKYAVAQYKYDWKSGKVSEADFGYVLDGSNGAGLLGMMMDVFPMEVAKIGDDKALVPGGRVLFDSDMKVVCDLDDIMPGAVSFDVVGEYLVLTDGTIARYYDSEGNVVGEYLSSLGINNDASGLLVKGNDYFTVSGEYLFTLGYTYEPGEKVFVASVPGKVYYVEMNEVDPDAEPDAEASAGDFKVYDVATGTSTTICEMENVIKDYFDHGIYITVDDSDNYSVVRVDDGSKLIDFSASDASVGMTAFGEDLLIKYSVTQVDGSVETEESRYILINIDTTTPELF